MFQHCEFVSHGCTYVQWSPADSKLQLKQYLKDGEVVRPLCDAVSSDHAVELCELKLEDDTKNERDSSTTCGRGHDQPVTTAIL